MARASKDVAVTTRSPLMDEANTTAGVLLYLENNMLKAIYLNPMTEGKPTRGLV